MTKKEILDKLGIKITSIKKIGNATIINNSYVMKPINRKAETFEYLLTRNFNYFPSVYSNINDEIEIMDYIEDKETPLEQRLEDIAYIASILHLNTTFDKIIDIDNIKRIYENTINKLTDLSNYYLDIQNVIEEEIYMSPANYLLIRNISLIYKAISLAREYIEKWYKEVEKTKSIRYAYIHGNLEESHLLENANLYLISWDKSKIDFPVKDLEIFYKKSYSNLDLKNILSIYEVKYPLKKEEKYLLYACLLIPDKIDFNKSEYPKIVDISNLILYLEKMISYLEYNSKKTNNNTNKQDKY